MSHWSILTAKSDRTYSFIHAFKADFKQGKAGGGGNAQEGVNNLACF